MNTYDISTDPSRLQLDAIHAWLTRSYWSPGVPRDVVARAIANSMCFRKPPPWLTEPAP